MYKETSIKGASSLVFMSCYLAAHAGVLMLAKAMNEPALSQSWSLLGEDADSAKHVVMYAPIGTPFLGSLVAGMRLQNAMKMGADRIGKTELLFTGWFAFVITNAMLLILMLNLFVERELGHLWVERLGTFRFNLWVFLVDPSLSLIAGFLGAFLTIALFEAQQS